MKFSFALVVAASAALPAGPSRAAEQVPAGAASVAAPDQAGMPAAPGVPGPVAMPPLQPLLRTDLSDAEKVRMSSESVARMRAALKQVLGRVEEARSEKDVVKLNCVNEKLTQIKGLLKVAEQSDVALNEALSAKQPGADAEFAKVNIARGKVDGLKADAEQCIGQLAYIIDEKTTVDVSQPTNLPNLDGTARLFGAGQAGLVPASPPPAERPMPASP
jgi:hypothetical protein